MDEPDLLSLPPRALLAGWKSVAALGIDGVGWLWRGIGRCVRPVRPFSAEAIKRILVIRLDHIGDVLMSTALLSRVYAAFPDAMIDVLVKPLCVPLLQTHPAVNHVFSYRAAWTQRAIDRDGESADPYLLEPYDLVISPRGDLRENWMARRLCRGWVTGFAVRGGAWCLDAVAPYRMNEHQIRREAALLTALGLSRYEDVAQECIYLREEELVGGAALLREYGVTGARPAVIVHTGAASPLKQWPVPRFIQVASALSKSGYDVLWTRGPADPEPRLDLPAVRIIPPLGLREFATLCANCLVLVCNDSGPMHLSLAAGTPVVAVFGPTLENVTGPRDARSVVLAASATQRPRWFPGTPAPPADVCRHSMEAVSVEEVLGTVRQIVR